MGSVIHSSQEMRANIFLTLAFLMLASFCKGQKKGAMPMDYGMMQKKGFGFGMMQKKGLDYSLDYSESGEMQKKGILPNQKKGFQKKGVFPGQKKGLDGGDVHVYITIGQKKGVEITQKKGIDMTQKKGIDMTQKKGIDMFGQKKGLDYGQKKGMYP